MVNNKSSIINDSVPNHFESLYPAESRFAEIEKILSFIKEGNSCELIGLPGAGRSNVFGLLSYNRNVREKHLGQNQKWFHFVLLNFSEVRHRILADVWKFIFLNLVDSLRERKMSEYEALNKIFKESSGANDEMVLFQGLKKAIDFLCIEKELTVVFLFDRFEEYIGSLESSFFTNLRVLRNRAKYRFSAVFSLPRPLEDVVEPTVFSDFHEFLAGHTVYLPLVDLPGLSFRISYLEKVSGKKLDKKILDGIIKLTGGHGKLTRLSAETILSVNVKSQISNLKLSNFLLEQKTIQGGLYEIWKALLPEEQKIVQNSVRQLADQSSYLESIGLIKAGEISIPIFAEFASAIQPLSHAAISFDSSTNEIKKGKAVISDQLSSSEFRLLKFLIENQGRICEKEEIIKEVWKDTKTQAGVTDQALDQIVYRLRKKIEDDPNKPIYIQTVKGRGIKFVENS